MLAALPDETLLVEQLIAGDEKAFGKIYAFYQSRLFLFAFRFTKSKSQAEEVVQEVFVRLWTKREQIRIEKNFSAYITRVAKNLILDGLKKAAYDSKVQKKIYENMQLIRESPIEELM
ncbi:MAG TPA: sigma-70 family RNA polymerase sigma factor, partial [Puia sp.]|nr:sigma-70 family RNA polymerase sigma factor [Puia sp.]